MMIYLFEIMSTWKEDGDEWSLEHGERFGLVILARRPARHILTVWRKVPGKWRLERKGRYSSDADGLASAKRYAEKLILNAS